VHKDTGTVKIYVHIKIQVHSIKRLSLKKKGGWNQSAEVFFTGVPAEKACPLVHPNRIQTCLRPAPAGTRLLIFLLGLILAALWIQPVFPEQASSNEGNQVRTEIPYRNGKVVVISDSQGEGAVKAEWHAKGHVKIYFEDIVITADEAVFNLDTKEGYTVGKTHFSQGVQWLTCSKAEFNFGAQTGTFYDATGYTDQEFSISGQTIIKTGPDTYTFQDGSITTCKGDHPKWKFTSSRSEIRLDHTARLRNTFLKVKGVPVFYTPYMILPLEKKDRSSGFTTFSTGTSTSKGRRFSQGYYQTLGRSADMTIYGDYFTLRGLALGGTLRMRPNPSTFLNFGMYGLSDKLNQGGLQLVVDGESRLRNDWRAVARATTTSNVVFRQAFADSFNNATITQENAKLFLTGNHGSFSTNIAYTRSEVAFPVKTRITRQIPSLEFLSLGTPLGNSPFIFSFRSSLEGISRSDSQFETEGIVQRLDIHPRLTIRLPSLLGFSLIPSIGVRETYYGAQISDDPETEIIHQGLHRRYADLNIDLKTPVLEKYYNASWLGSFRHLIEPYAAFRWTHGIEGLQRIIRFDENDVIADTREVEYGLINRFYTQKKNGSGGTEKHEFMTVALIQKYYFDPSFGGAFQQGHANSFYPLNTATGFYQTGIERNLSPVSAIVRIWRQNGLHHDIRADYDLKLQRWRNASLSTEWQKGKFSLTGTYFRTAQTEPGLFPSNQLQGNISYGSPARGFLSSLSVSYNFLTSQLLNSSTVLSYVWDCCSVSTQFNQYSLGLRTETQFSFSFGLKGIGSFGNLKKADSLF
jgi:LPS-assembly protein